MISWIVASHDEQILQSVLMASLTPLPLGDEIIIERGAPSITWAYAVAQAQATQPVRCYIHHDVRVLDLKRLRRELLGMTLPDQHEITTYGSAIPEFAPGRDVGMVGVIGSHNLVMPWWDGYKLGSVVDARLGSLHFGRGGPCAVLDGLLLATRQTMEWDTEAPGWHGYDHDACAQMLALRMENRCLTDGHELVEHVTTGSTDTTKLPGWDAAVARFKERWG